MWHDILDSLLKDLKRLSFYLRGSILERCVDDLFGFAFLACLHEAVDKTLYQLTVVNRVWRNFSWRDWSFSWHFSLLSSFLRSLGAVFAPRLRSVGDTRCLLGSANDVISDTWQVFDTTTSHEHNRVLLQVVSHAWDVGRDLESVCETHTSHLPHC